MSLHCTSAIKYVWIIPEFSDQSNSDFRKGHRRYNLSFANPPSGCLNNQLNCSIDEDLSKAGTKKYT